MLGKCGVAFDFQGICSLGDGGGHSDGGSGVARCRRRPRRIASTVKCVRFENRVQGNYAYDAKSEAQDQVVLVAKGL